MICVPEARADRRLVAQHRAAHAGVAAGVGVEVVLDLGDVALEAGAQREQPRHLLPEELRRMRLGAVDAGRAADDDRPERGHPLAGREQLERADHVDVVHRARRHPRAGLAHDLLVDDRVDAGRRDQPRRSPGRGCRPRCTRCGRARACGRRVSRPATCSTSGSRSSRWARRLPTWLPTPVISTRRPATTTAAARRLASRQALLDASSVEPAADRAQLRLDLLEVVVRDGPAALDGLRPSSAARARGAPRRRAGLPESPGRRARLGADGSLRRAEGRLDGALDRVAEVVGVASLGHQPLLRALPWRLEHDVSPNPPAPGRRAGRARPAAGRPRPRARRRAGAARAAAADVQSRAWTMGLHGHGPTASRSRSRRPGWAARAPRS